MGIDGKQSQGKLSQEGHLAVFPSREQHFWGGPEGTILGGALERGHLGQDKHGTLKWVSDWGTWDGSWGPLLRVIWGVTQCPGEGIRRGQEACRGKGHSKEKLLTLVSGHWLAIRTWWAGCLPMCLVRGGPQPPNDLQLGHSRPLPCRSGAGRRICTLHSGLAGTQGMVTNQKAAFPGLPGIRPINRGPSKASKRGSWDEGPRVQGPVLALSSAASS